MPAVINGIEGSFGGNAGADEKEGLVFFTVRRLYDGCCFQQQIFDASKFQKCLSRVIDGPVQLLNASLWAKPAKYLSDLFAPILQRLFQQRHKLIRDCTVD